MTLFQKGNFQLHSGDTANWKIECDALTRDDWNGLAVMAVELFGRPGSVMGVPRGGTPFAHALEPHGRKDGPLWIVDDVLTTGNSMVEYAKCLDEIGNINRGLTFGIVVFARRPCPFWIRSIFQMPA